MSQTGFSLIGAALGAILFVSAGRDPLRRVMDLLKR